MIFSWRATSNALGAASRTFISVSKSFQTELALAGSPSGPMISSVRGKRARWTLSDLPDTLGRYDHTSSVVKLMMGATSRTRASTMRQVAVWAERREWESGAEV